jgi:thioesterase domain-containing protein
MAQHYLTEIRTARPSGPYFIGGTCTGGVIAYELAQRLVAQGEDVRLTLLETWPPATARARHSWLRFLWPAQYLVLKLAGYARELSRMPMRDWPQFVRQKLRTGRAVFDVGLRETLEGSTYYVEKVVDATMQAVARYEPKPYSGSLLNVIAVKRPLPSQALDTRRTWEGLTRGPNETVLVDAEDSGRLFISPHVEVVADVLKLHVQATLPRRAQPADVQARPLPTSA